MANELTISASLAFTKGNIANQFLSLTSTTFDVTGDKYVAGVQEIGLTEEAIDVGDLGTCGYGLFINLDATNFVEIRPGSAIADLIKVGPGEVALFRLAMNGPYAIADTAVCNLQYLIIEA